MAVQPVAEARSGARPRVCRGGIRVAHDCGRCRRRRDDLAVVLDRGRLGVAVHGHRQAPRRTRRAGRRRDRTPPRARAVLALVLELCAGGRVERDRSSRTACGRSRSRRRWATPLWFQLSIVPVRARRSCATPCCSNRAAAARPKSSCCPIACCSSSARVWAVLFGIAVIGYVSMPEEQLLTGWGRTAPTLRDRAHASPARRRRRARRRAQTPAA